MSIHATRRDDEISEVYGERIYRGMGPVRVKLVVRNAREALFTPAIYQVKDVQVIEGNPAAEEATELISYEGLFSGLADVGDWVEVVAKLESVNNRPLRLVVGAAGIPGGGTIFPPRGEL